MLEKSALAELCEESSNNLLLGCLLALPASNHPELCEEQLAEQQWQHHTVLSVSRRRVDAPIRASPVQCSGSVPVFLVYPDVFDADNRPRESKINNLRLDGVLFVPAV
ncbi:unnamed protein product [Pleuronectes platessa]|uniref:Uncharacterized protein n=1 Tax=Pleuronectes platessa TaxID=8262 RepID=A0A9N7UUS2_PLEPL|nr:unnamed protein product [Pleuronectes platessa]